MDTRIIRRAGDKAAVEITSASKRRDFDQTAEVGIGLRTFEFWCEIDGYEPLVIEEATRELVLHALAKRLGMVPL